MSQPGSVLVFGGSRGIGAAVARFFVARGDRVGVVARRATGEHAGRTIVADVASDEAVSSAYQAFGEVDLVVHAAAVSGVPGAVGPLWQTDVAAFDEVVGVNLCGAYHVLHHGLRAMLAAGRAGTVVLFSGGGAAYARPRFAAYGAAKTAVVRLVESTAAELREAGHDIGVFAIAPGAVHTAMTEEVLADETRSGPAESDAARAVVRDGGVDPRRAAELCAFLATPRARSLAGRLLHVAEPYREYTERELAADAGCLRRRNFA